MSSRVWQRVRARVRACVRPREFHRVVLVVVLAVGILSRDFHFSISTASSRRSEILLEIDR